MSPEGTDFLYPFIEGDETDSSALLVDLSGSAVTKVSDRARLAAEMLSRWSDETRRLAAEMAVRVRGGGRVYTFGNGGSATDAASLASLLERPPHGRSVAARSLVADQAVVTAIGNDVGFDLVFARQLIAFAQPSDVAIGYSTSGNSNNVIAALTEAKRRGLLTVGFAGYDGGRMGACGALDFCFVVACDSVHRIQESQAALSVALWSALQAELAQAPPW